VAPPSSEAMVSSSSDIRGSILALSSGGNPPDGAMEHRIGGPGRRGTDSDRLRRLIIQMPVLRRHALENLAEFGFGARAAMRGAAISGSARAPPAALTMVNFIQESPLCKNKTAQGRRPRDESKLNTCWQSHQLPVIFEFLMRTIRATRKHPRTPYALRGKRYG